MEVFTSKMTIAVIMVHSECPGETGKGRICCAVAFISRSGTVKIKFISRKSAGVQGEPPHGWNSLTLTHGT